MLSLVRTTGIQRLGPSLARRMASGAPVGVSHAGANAKPAFNKALPKAYQYSFTKSWLSDPSTYPLLGAMVFASALVVGFSVNALTRYKGVKISSAHKNAIMPLPSESPTERQVHLAEAFVGKHSAPTSFHARKYTTLTQEGLGVDHEAWKAAKEAQAKKSA